MLLRDLVNQIQVEALRSDNSDFLKYVTSSPNPKRGDAFLAQRLFYQIFTSDISEGEKIYHPPLYVYPGMFSKKNIQKLKTGRDVVEAITATNFSKEFNTIFQQGHRFDRIVQEIGPDNINDGFLIELKSADAEGDVPEKLVHLFGFWYSDYNSLFIGGITQIKTAPGKRKTYTFFTAANKKNNMGTITFEFNQFRLRHIKKENTSLLFLDSMLPGKYSMTNLLNQSLFKIETIEEAL